MSSIPLSPELGTLLESLCAGELQIADARRLEGLLAADPAQCRHYVRFMHLHAMVERLEATSPITMNDEAGASLSARRFPTSRSVVWSVLAVGVLFACYIVGISWNMLSQDSGGELRAVATVRESKDVRWSESVSDRLAAASSPGAKIAAGEKLSIDAGRIELQLKQGAKLIVEGPAAWSIDGDNDATLQRGKIFAKVPKRAIGFTLQTPSAKIVDLGTEFGVTVSESGDSEVHVVRGSVDATQSSGPKTGTPQRLLAGEALRIDAAGGVPRKIAASPRLFAAATPPRSQVTLLGFYPFDGDAHDASGNGRDATKVDDVTFADGFEGQAAHFAGTEHSVIELPIDVSVSAAADLTWGAWVKPSGPIVSRSEILSSDDGEYDRILTIDHRSGRISEQRYCFAASCGPKVGILLSKGPLPDPARWTFVAGVYRSALRMASIYVEDPALAGGKGGLVTDIAADVSIGTSHGKVYVGNHAVGKEPFAGSIDNAFILRGALGYRELDAIRTAGAKKILELASPTQNDQP